MIDVRVVGAGLAGSEAALQLARFGLNVDLYDIKPRKKTAAHRSDNYAELVCSNSLKSTDINTASGLLKQELRALGSELLKIADSVRVPAGTALAVDRKLFSEKVSEKIKNEKLIHVHCCEITKLPRDDITTIIATGPLTTKSLYDDIEKFTGKNNLHFYDAVSPIVSRSSLNEDKIYYASRYGKSSPDYINCPLNEEEYDKFYEALVNAECAEVKDFDSLLFANCQPIEEIARRGRDTMRFGLLKPQGLVDERSGETPFACLQLRQENQAATMYSLVGCQTRLTFPEQRRVFSIIPALKNAEFLRYGVMHRNSFIAAPEVLQLGFSTAKNENIYFAGQLSGVEGYVESIASGLMAAHQAAAKIYNLSTDEALRLLPGDDTISGALARYLINTKPHKFQPMNANFGLLPLSKDLRLKKQERNPYRVQRSKESIEKTAVEVEQLADEIRKSRDKHSYFYDLPTELIAEEPSQKRDHSRLLVYKKHEDLKHCHFYDLPKFLHKGDLLLMNNTRVLPARLYAIRARTGAHIECLLLQPIANAENTWDVLAKPGRRCKVGDRLIFSENELEADVIGSYERGRKRLRFFVKGNFDEIIERLGEVPLPPYIHKKLDNPERYQTVYAVNKGSVAAPTAGLHFTKELIKELQEQAVEIKYLTLHVGAGTFRPVKTDNITDHLMHSERYYLPQETADSIVACKERGGRVIAVGTTSCRVLETVAKKQSYSSVNNHLNSDFGESKLFIYPGFKFRVIDGLITNFHLPESTLLMLVSALMGREEILAVYKEAIERQYRFFSFGDAMLLLP